MSNSRKTRVVEICVLNKYLESCDNNLNVNKELCLLNLDLCRGFGFLICGLNFAKFTDSRQ